LEYLENDFFEFIWASEKGFPLKIAKFYFE
jgi:hypothetical protein